jgi:hypothetical protein
MAEKYQSLYQEALDSQLLSGAVNNG